MSTIHFYIGESWEKVTPASMTTGTGGSEIAVIAMARAFTSAGHDVTVWGTSVPPNDTSGFGVWRAHEDWNPQIPCDLLVLWRQVPPIKGMWRAAAKRVVLWLHDLLQPPFAPIAVMSRIDDILVLSHFHKRRILDAAPELRPKLVVIPNGIVASRYQQQVERHHNHYFYSSSPRRGLQRLLDEWPAVYNVDPDSRLHVAYGFELAIRIAQNNEPHIVPQLKELLGRVQSMPGVVYHGRIGQDELARLQLSCFAWLYPPNDFNENCCITSLEAQAAGCVPITRDNGGLPDTLHNYVRWDQERTLHSLLPHAVEVDVVTNQERALGYDWSLIADDWAAVFLSE